MAISESQKRKYIRSYFDDERAALAWALILIGIPAIFAFLIGIVMIIVGVFLLWRRRSLTSDEQIDAWIEEDYRRHDFIDRARQLIGFHEEVREPVLLKGGAGGANEEIFTGEKWGDDGVMRETPLSAAVILCSRDQIAIYRTGLDLTTGNRVNERVYEAFYQDVVSINVVSHSQSIDLDAARKQLSAFKSLNPKEVQKGLTKTKLKMSISGIRSRFANELINDTLQRERSRVYHIGLSNGENIMLPISDGRPTRLANASDDTSLGQAASSMLTLRNFVREKKCQILAETASGGGPLI